MIPKHRQGNICKQGIYVIRQTHLERSTQRFRANTAGGLGKAGNIYLGHLKMTLVQRCFSMKIVDPDQPQVAHLKFYQHISTTNAIICTSALYRPWTCLCTSLNKLQPAYQYLQSDCVAQNINATQQNNFGRTPDNVQKPSGTNGRRFAQNVLFLSLSRCTYKAPSEASKKTSIYI